MELAEKHLQTSISPKLERILFATDLSGSSEAALPYVEDIARCYGSTIFVAHVIPPEPLPIAAAEAIDCTRAVVTDCAKRELNATGLTLRKVPHQLLLAYGEVAPALLGIIQANHIDLVVVGTHGRHGFERLFLGSVAERLFRASPVPVLTIGPRTATTPGGLKSKNVVYPVEDRGSAIGTAYVRSLACEYGAHLVLLHVLPEASASNSSATMTKSVEAKLRELFPAGPQEGYTVECRVKFGEPAESILRVARETKAGLIVLDVHRSHFLANLAQDIAYDVVCQAICPVLTLRV